MDRSRTRFPHPPTTRRIAVAPLLLAVGLGAAACGSTDGAPAAAAGSLATVEAFEEAWASALCERYSRCGELPGEDGLGAANFRNRAACLRIFGASIRRARPVAALTRAVVRYDAAAARRCVDQQRATCPIPGIQDVGGCREVYVGTLAAGAACASDTECLPGNTCERTGGCSGTCRPAGARGAPCNTPDTPFACAPPVGGTGYCGSLGSSGIPGVCNHYRPGPAATQGMPCGVTPGASATEFVVTACAIGLACARTMAGSTCQPLAAAGAPCGTGGIVCEAGSTCMPVAGRFVCQAATVRAMAGGSCGGRTMAVCDPATLFCTDDNMGVCAVAGRGGNGAPCAPGEFGAAACAPGLVCAGATPTCVPPVAEGQPCRRDADCVSGTCDTFANTCQPPCG